MKTWHVLLPVFVLGSGMFYAKQFRQQRAEMEQLRQQTVALGESIEEGQQRMGQRLAAQSLLLGLAKAAPASEPSKDPVAAAAPEKKVASAPEAVAPRRELSPTEIATRMDAAFSRETPDREWSAKTQQVTQQKIGTLLPKDSSVRSVDCRTSLCRVEMSHQNMGDYRKFVNDALVAGDAHVWDGPTFSTVLHDSGSGEVITVSYLAREGHSLPEMQE